MSFNAAALKVMLQKGLTLGDVAEIAEANEARQSPAAVRQKRYRDNKRSVTRDVTPPLNDKDILIPPESSEPSGSSSRNAPWPCPVGVEPGHWRDFLKNRKTRHLTNSETARQGQMRALEQLSDDEWPPGRLVQHAAERGWGSINDPRVSRHGQQSSDNRKSGWQSAYSANIGSGGTG